MSLAQSFDTPPRAVPTLSTVSIPSYYSVSPPPSPTATTTTTAAPTSFFETSGSISRSSKRPSLSSTLSGTMSGWLSSHRSNSSRDNSTYRISEPQLTATLDVFAPNQRFKAAVNRTLGMGAQVVRTPEDALASSLVTGPPPVNTVEEEEDEFDFRASIDSIATKEYDGSSPTPTDATPPSPPRGPRASRSSPHLSRSITPPKPKRALPPAPINAKQIRPALKPTSPMQSPEPQFASLPPLAFTTSTSDFSAMFPPPVPSLPKSPTTPTFIPVLISPCPDTQADHTQIIIQLETSSSSLRTTVHTLTTVPSRLSDYLTTLLPPSDSPPPSPTSPFSSAFQKHQESIGVHHSRANKTPAPPMHIFLDRPSSPYAHILAFLRSGGTILPRPVQLSPSYSTSRFEALLELRDEARYLGMTVLEKLADEELLKRQRGHSRGGAYSGSGGSRFLEERVSIKRERARERDSAASVERDQIVSSASLCDDVPTPIIASPLMSSPSPSPPMPLITKPITAAPPAYMLPPIPTTPLSSRGRSRSVSKITAHMIGGRI